MGKAGNSSRLDTIRTTYREALEAARAHPTPEAWAKLLAAGKELSALEEPRTRNSRKSKRGAVPSYRELEDPAEAEPREVEHLE